MSVWRGVFHSVTGDRRSASQPPQRVSVPAAATAMGVYRFLSAVRLPILPRLALPRRPPHVLPRVLRPVTFSRKYCSGIIRSPFDDVQIPEISFTEYIFNAQEPFADKLALVSPSLRGRIMFYRALCDGVPGLVD